ncbi:MAG: hypothetical protein J5736_02825 [Bacilli bacterium]|nr:hypothetical protein [Bacilli bacterium]
MKAKAGLLFLSGLCLLLSSCFAGEPSSTSILSSEEEEDIYVERPEDTNLSFWITERPTQEELREAECTFLPGMFGGQMWLDGRYEAVDAGPERGYVSEPDIHVVYTLAGYPDAIDPFAVTHIDITDPEITVYGLSMRSTPEEVAQRMKGFADEIRPVETDVGITTVCRIKKASFLFSQDSIRILVPTTNETGIVF